MSNSVLKYALDTHHFPVNCAMLEEEERIYATYLKNVQGNVVPRIYGYFKGMAEAKFPVACLILEDCGDAVTTRFDKLSLEDRWRLTSRNLFASECSTDAQEREKIFKQVLAVHECNVLPGRIIRTQCR